MKFPIIIKTRAAYYEALDENLVSGYLAAVSAIDGKKKVYLEPVTLNCKQATVKDCVFLGAVSRGGTGLYIVSPAGD